MIPLLYHQLERFIAGRGWLSPLQVFEWVEFRAILAIVLAFALVLLLGKRTIRGLVKLKIADRPEFYNKDLNQIMKGKANTPTMGGILISGAIFIVVLLLADLASFYVVMALVCLVWLLAIGAVDDYLKLTAATRKPGSRQGLYSHEKLLAQLAIALVLGLFIHHWGGNNIYFPDPDEQKAAHAFTLPFFKTWDRLGDGSYQLSAYIVPLGTWAFVALTILVIAGTSNAVNLTDGMDGLAGGVMTIVAFAFLVLALIAGYRIGAPPNEFVLAKYLLVPHIRFSDELAVVCGAMVGACLGFLWFNCSPAQVFMGDSGSLPLGGLIGYVAVVIRQEFLLFIIGGIFFIEMFSVIIQVGYFKLSGGKRVFLCAPIHHHFHLKGWTEQQVVVRAWLITALLVAMALATIKVR